MVELVQAKKEAATRTTLLAFFDSCQFSPQRPDAQPLVEHEPVEHAGSGFLRVEAPITAPPVISLRTGVSLGVSPGSIWAYSHSFPQVSIDSLILWLTSTFWPFASQT